MEEYVPTGFFIFSLALINAGLAEQKDRSRWAWFLVSLFLGPLATAMIVIWKPPIRAEVAAAAVDLR
ncbi:hypothetical protein [Arthrobacter agilis]|jgi:hypothetical protein|uniref:hypothetical protein n=1 Tax=Arthrobacter agilis TaxID=37921 RepID=UPI0027892266|nr:hypothetical protein [Arthrobacter agilis]MDQ0734668.1 hypothetical protein [Arthrobacter agilis]